MSNPSHSHSAHWDAVYQRLGNAEGRPAGMSWYRPHLERSLHWIGELTAGDTAARVIDVGTGESTLADDLLARGYRSLTLVDLSVTALEHLCRIQQGKLTDSQFQPVPPSLQLLMPLLIHLAQ